MKYLLTIMLILLSVAPTSASTLVSENFDDQAYVSPLNYYNVTGYNQNIIYDSTNAYGGSGYCLKFDHSLGYLAGLGILSGFDTYVDEGVYVRYWLKYDADYLFPGDMGVFENLKMFKLAGAIGWDVEFIYKGSAGGPSALYVYWNDSDGYQSYQPALGERLLTDEWHKIEIYIKIAATSIIHIQVDDYDIYENTNADIRADASDYTGTQQFMSIRASTGTPPSGNGFFYTDNVTIITNEGDLCDSEPVESGGAATATLTGTLNGSSEEDVVAGGKTLIVNIYNDTLIADFGTDIQCTADIIAALTGSGSYASGWEEEMAMTYADVVRTSDTVGTFNLPATTGYDVDSNQTITLGSVPASCLTGGVAIGAVSGSALIYATQEPVPEAPSTRGMSTGERPVNYSSTGREIN